ncbi:hypothetical protein BC941DRAFT_477167 [Chlamydoabsidia padenii]|nr:hypothetical protein BC941DRAFT_477167 [Chlamydoabsidia padenii]
MNSFINTATNLLQSQYTRNIRPFNDSENKTVVFVMPRHQYLAWIINVSERTSCKYIFRSSGPRLRLNKEFMEKFVDHDFALDSIAETETIGMKRGRPGSDFQECQRWKKPSEDNFDPKNVKIVYKFEHVGHVAGSLADLQVIGVSGNLRNVINDLVERNLSGVAIKHMLRVNRTILTSILSGTCNNIPQTMRISYQTVYYAVKKCLDVVPPRP